MAPDDDSDDSDDSDDEAASPPDETRPALRIDLPTRMYGPPTVMGKRVDLEQTVEVTATPQKRHRGSREDSSDWRTRITKVQAVKPTSASGDECLVLIYPPGAEMGKRFPLARNELILGRGADVDIQVDRDSVSRRHARVFRGGDDWFAEDLQSTNGTYVNDVPISKSPLIDGDFLKIGAAIFKYLAGAGIEASYHEEIYKLTIVDALTGAHNKRYLLDFLEREIPRCARHGGTVSLLMFDIDHFKQINDQHGHLTGDYVLREIGRRLLGRVRREELLARYGGEEFAIVLPESDLAAARTFAEQVRRTIADQPFEYEGDTFEVTVSIGVACIEGEDLDVSQFVKIADDNLYRAKREGRNRVVSGAAGEWNRWKANPAFRTHVSTKAAVAAISLLARDHFLASDGGVARVDDLEGLLYSKLREQDKSNKSLGFGALEGGNKLLVSVEGRNPLHRLRLLTLEAVRKVADERPEAQFAIGPVRTMGNGKAIEEAVSGLDDEIAILENGRYLPQPVAIALRATDSVTNARAKSVLELGETLLQWLALCAAADLAVHGEAPRTTAMLKRGLKGGVTMGRWHELFVTAVKELLESISMHDAAWRVCFGDKTRRSEIFSWLASLVEVRNAFAHGATASDEHVARKIVDEMAPRLRQLIKRDLRAVLALIPADVELVGFEGELQSYRMTRLIGDGIPASVSAYSRRRMNPGLWLCDAIADRALPLEPFFVRDTCPKCGARELFLLTRLDEVEFRNPATGHVLKKPVDDLPLPEDARDRLRDLTD